MPRTVVCKLINFPIFAQGHCHSHAHLIVPMNEPVDISYDGLSYTLSVGYMAFISPYSYHTYHGKENKETIVIDIPTNILKSRDYSSFNYNKVIAINESIMPIMSIIKNELKTNPNSDSVQYLFYFIYDKYIARQSFKSLKYIEDNYSENISVAKLAEIENYNRFYYTDWFKSKTGVLPSEYIQAIRIEKAKILLINTDYKILDIALQVGYDNSSSFTRAFKKIEHISPREYRYLYFNSSNIKNTVYIN